MSERDWIAQRLSFISNATNSTLIEFVEQLVLTEAKLPNLSYMRQVVQFLVRKVREELAARPRVS